MKFTSISLGNFRGIQEMDVPINHQLTIFVGRNGVGKSTVLDAAAILLSWAVARAKSVNGAGRSIQELDIRNQSHHASLIAHFQTSNLVPFDWNLSKTRKGHIKSEVASDLSALTSFGRLIQQAITITDSQTNIPLFAYYPVNRAVLDIPLRIRKSHTFELLEAWDESLTSAANFRSFFEWFRNREDLENENRLRHNDTIQQASNDSFDPQLQAVRQAIESIVTDFSNLSVRRNPLRMTVSKLDEEILIDQLSDGEKCLIALVGDIARRLAIANPKLGNPLEGEGVLLIDEIDLHLHPGWQRNVVPRLLKTFPNCQFIVSTHSPQVLGEVSADHVRLLSREDGKIIFTTPKQTLGLTSNEILDELMYTDERPTVSQNLKVESDLRRLFDLIDEGNFDKATEFMAELKNQYQGDTPELVRAMSLLTMLAPSHGGQ